MSAPSSSPAAIADALDDAAVLRAICDAAGAAILPWFRGAALTVDDKASAGFDPVTEADRAAERAMRALLERLRPEDAILGEEYGAAPGTSGRVWTLDPIDGTRAFICGFAHWGTLAALSEGDRAILGALDQPYIGERFVGGVGAARFARLERRGGASAPLSTRRCGALSDAILLTTDPRLFQGEHADAFARVTAAARMTRFGGDCYNYAMVAAGSADLAIEAGLAPYDIRALIPIVEAAGGVITDWRGGSAHEGGAVVAAGDPAIHEAALKLLSA